MRERISVTPGEDFEMREDRMVVFEEESSAV